MRCRDGESSSHPCGFMLMGLWEAPGFSRGEVHKTEEIPAVDENDKHYIIESDGNNGFIARMEGNDDSFTADTPGDAFTGLMNKLKANDDGQ